MYLVLCSPSHEESAFSSKQNEIRHIASIVDHSERYAIERIAMYEPFNPETVS